MVWTECCYYSIKGNKKYMNSFGKFPTISEESHPSF